MDLFDKHELDSAVIGEVTDTDRFVLKYEDEVYADIPVDALADEAPVYILEGEEKEYNTSKMIIVRSMYKMYLKIIKASNNCFETLFI